MVKSDATAYLDNLGCAHVVYFHDGGDKSQTTEFDFIKKGVDKQQHCFYTTQNPEKILRQAEIEQCVDDDFHKIKGNFVCSFSVGRITIDIRSRFLNQLLESHRAIVFQTAKDGTEVFTLP